MSQESKAPPSRRVREKDGAPNAGMGQRAFANDQRLTTNDGQLIHYGFIGDLQAFVDNGEGFKGV